MELSKLKILESEILLESKNVIILPVHILNLEVQKMDFMKNVI